MKAKMLYIFILVSCIFISVQAQHTGHPRLFFTASDIQSIKDRISVSPVASELYANIVIQSDYYKTNNLYNLDAHDNNVADYSASSHNKAAYYMGVPSLAFRYLVTGDVQYANKALDLIFNPVNSDIRLQGIVYDDWSNIDANSRLRALCQQVICLSIMYDWLNDELSTEQKNLIQDKIIYTLSISFEWFPNYQNGIRACFNREDAYRLRIEHASTALTLAAMSLYGENAKYSTSQADDDINTAITYEYTATQSLQNRIWSPYDGATPDGIYYGMWMLPNYVTTLEAWSHWDGVNHWNDPNIRDRYSKIGDWLAYEVMPQPRQAKCMFNALNDVYSDLYGPLSMLLVFSAKYPEKAGLLSWVFNSTIGNISGLLQGTDANSMQEGMGNSMDYILPILSGYNNFVDPIEPSTVLPQSKDFLWNGLVQIRNSQTWGDANDIQFAFTSRPYIHPEFNIWNFHHDQPDKNHFTLSAYGDLYFRDYGYGNQNTAVRGPEYHNIVMVDGNGEVPSNNAITQGQIVQHASSPTFDFIHGNATDAYNEFCWGAGQPVTHYTGFNTVQRAHRYVVFSRAMDNLPPYFIIADDIQKEDGNPHTYSWRFHTAKPVSGPNTIQRSDATPIKLSGTNGNYLEMYMNSTSDLSKTSTYLGRSETICDVPTAYDLTTQTSVVNPYFHAALVPHKSGDPLPAYTSTNITNGSIITLTWPSPSSYIDYSVFKYQNEQHTSGLGFVADAKLSRIRKNTITNAVSSFMIAEGTSLTDNGTVLVQTYGTSATVMYSGTSVTINGSVSNYFIYAPNALTLVINGVTTNLIRAGDYVASAAIAATIPTAGTAMSVSSTDFIANWTIVSGATKYYLDVATNSDFTSFISGYPNKDVGNANLHSVYGLNPNTSYWYRVRAYNGTSSTSSNKVNVYTAPSAPTANAATNIGSTSFRANWTTVIGAIKYYLDVSTSSSFTSFISGYQNKDVGNVLLYSVTGLSANTTYYYRVRAYNGAASSSSNIISTTTLPAAPTATAATYINSTVFRANWTAVGGATKYYLDVATNSGFTSYVTGYQNKDVGAAIYYSVTGLNLNTTYYYRVRTYIVATSPNSNTISVKTVLGAPTATAATNISTTSFSANWIAVSGATKYYLDVASDSSFTSFVTGYQNKDVGTAISYSVTGLKSYTSYKFRVRAFNGKSSSNSNTVFVNTAFLALAATSNGIITYSGGKTIHTFISSGTFTATGSGNAEVLLVAGGGSGGTNRYRMGGGGGAGGVVYYPSTLITSGSYNVNAGPASVSANGYNSTFTGLTTAIGGGYGGPGAIDAFSDGVAGGDGGSGGGGGGCYVGHIAGVHGNGTSGQGYDGADSQPAGGIGNGGGAGGVGLYGDNGGEGVTYSISGTSVTYAQGGRATGGGLTTPGCGGASGCAGQAGIVIVSYSTTGSPATAATNINSTSFKANWNVLGGAAKYYLDIATDTNFTSFVSGYNNKDVGNVIFYSVTGMNTNTTYYYRVRAYSGILTPNSNTITVKTAPAAPTATAATDITPTSFKANWGSVSGASYYFFDVSTEYSFNSYVSGYKWITVYGTTCSVTGLNPNTTYYYRVRSYNGAQSLSSNKITVTTTLSTLTATGGTKTYSGGKTIHTFTSNGTFTVTGSGNAEILIVAGGGGGGAASQAWYGGGGGAGGLVHYDSTLISTGSYTVTVGSGGGVGENGGNSSFGSLVYAMGGGYGGFAAISENYNGGNGGYGGSGGGGGAAAGTGTPGNRGSAAWVQVGLQGTDGEEGGTRSGWGGGAGCSGFFRGCGLTYSISGSAVIYAKGGSDGPGYDYPSYAYGEGGAGGRVGNSGVVIVSYYTGGLAKSSQGYNGKLAEELPVPLPIEYCLTQNYPNPFNPSTVINYQLPDAGTRFLVSLKVYDILGREVITLADGMKDAGYYSTTFYASHLSSGIYFARIIASPEDGNKPFIKIVKMLLIK